MVKDHTTEVQTMASDHDKEKRGIIKEWEKKYRDCEKELEAAKKALAATEKELEATIERSEKDKAKLKEKVKELTANLEALEQELVVAANTIKELERVVKKTEKEKVEALETVDVLNVEVSTFKKSLQRSAPCIHIEIAAQVNSPQLKNCDHVRTLRSEPLPETFKGTTITNPGHLSPAQPNTGTLPVLPLLSPGPLALLDPHPPCAT